MATDIVKLVSREVQFWEDGRLVQTLQEDCTANLSRDRNGIIIEDIKGKKYQIFTANIDTTKLDPAPSVKFVGTTQDLWNLLFDPTTTNFFNELHIGSSTGGATGHFLGAFADENTGGPTFFPVGPYSSGSVYYNTSIDQIMYYDSSRSRFLSIATLVLSCGRTSTTSAGAFFRSSGNVTFILNSRGWYAPNDGVIVGVTGTRTDTDDAQIEVMDGAAIAVELDFGTSTTASNTYNTDVTGGNIITVRVKPASNAISDGIIIVAFKLKSP